MRWWVRAPCQELVSILCIKEIQSGADGYIRDWWYWHNVACEYVCVCVWVWINYIHSMCACYIRLLGSDDVCRSHIFLLLSCLWECPVYIQVGALEYTMLTKQHWIMMTVCRPGELIAKQTLRDASDLAAFWSSCRGKIFAYRVRTSEA